MIHCKNSKAKIQQKIYCKDENNKLTVSPILTGALLAVKRYDDPLQSWKHLNYEREYTKTLEAHAQTKDGDSEPFANAFFGEIMRHNVIFSQHHT